MDDQLRRASDPFIITLKDVYDVTMATKGTVDGLVQTTALNAATTAEDTKDHELRIRSLEAGRWKTTASLLVAAFALGAWGADTFNLIGGLQ